MVNTQFPESLYTSKSNSGFFDVWLEVKVKYNKAISLLLSSSAWGLETRMTVQPILCSNYSKPSCLTHWRVLLFIRFRQVSDTAVWPKIAHIVCICTEMYLHWNVLSSSSFKGYHPVWLLSLFLLTCSTERWLWSSMKKTGWRWTLILLSYISVSSYLHDSVSENCQCHLCVLINPASPFTDTYSILCLI